MAKGYLIDTNVLIDAQVGRIPAKAQELLSIIIDVDFTISFVTYIEYLGYKNITEVAAEFIRLADVICIDKDIMDVCVELRKSHMIKLPDAIIASTALVKGLILLTRNTSDFERIDGLLIVNPWEFS